MEKQNGRWEKKTLRDIMELFVLPVKKPPEEVDEEVAYYNERGEVDLLCGGQSLMTRKASGPEHLPSRGQG